MDYEKEKSVAVFKCTIRSDFCNKGEFYFPFISIPVAVY